nr:GNAT family N-acetyltransferase [Actibacterium sp. 188UL27-1]
MSRAQGAKCTLMGRLHDQIAGVGFVACDGETAMAHAIDVHPDFRRQNLARNMMRAAAIWSQDQGAGTLCVAVTHANTGARALYTSLGMRTVGHYHYRQKPQ